MILSSAEQKGVLISSLQLTVIKWVEGGHNKQGGVKYEPTIFFPPRSAHSQFIPSSRDEKYGV